MSSKIKNILGGLVASLFILLFIEGFARIIYTIHTDRNAETGVVWQQYSPDIWWEVKPNYEGDVGWAAYRSYDESGILNIDTAQANGERKGKIVFIGDSNIFGLQIASEKTFVEVFDKKMPEMNAINLGIPGYTSFQGLQQFRQKVIPMQAEVAVLSFNFNDRRYVMTPTQPDGAEAFQNAYKEIQKANRFKLDYIYTYRIMADIMERFGMVKHETPNNKKAKIQELISRVSPTDYQNNLRSFIQLAKANNIDLVFMLLKDNPTQSFDLNEGIAHLEKGEYDLAIEHLKSGVNADNYFSTLSRKYLIKAYERSGQKDKIKDVEMINPFISMAGGLPIYTDNYYNELMKTVANEHNIPVIDAGNFLIKKPSDFMDQCHPDANGHLKIANLLYEHFNKINTEELLSTVSNN